MICRCHAITPPETELAFYFIVSRVPPSSQYKLEAISSYYNSKESEGRTMSNQVLLWILLVLPWFTLFFMPKSARKRFMPVGQFSIITCILFVEMGQTLGWFVWAEAAYPFKTPSYIFGLNTVATMWLFYFLYGRFWRFLAIDIILNFGFIYLFHVYYLGNRGIFHEVALTPLMNVVYAIIIGIMLYGYQMWQEGIFSQSTIHSTNLQPAATKPLPERHEDNDDE
jgi:hypothetical protein